MYTGAFSLVTLNRDDDPPAKFSGVMALSFASPCEASRDNWIRNKKTLWQAEVDAGTHKVAVDSDEILFDEDDLIEAEREYQVRIERTLTQIHIFTVSAENETDAEETASMECREFDWDFADDTCYDEDFDIEHIEEA
jgi:hypothetical protein